MIHLAASYYPHKAAISFYGTEITFWQLRNQVIRLANGLRRLGLRKGERVGIALPTCPQYVIAYYAALSLGTVVVNMNPGHPYQEIKLLMENTTPETLITIDTALPVMRLLISELEIKKVIVTRLTDYIREFDVSTALALDLEKGWHHFSELITGSSDRGLPPVSVSPGDPAMIQFTGGTTGRPKGALLTHANIIAATYAACFWGSTTNNLTTPGSRTVLSVIPYFHIYGNIVAMNWGVFHGATQILFHRFDLEELFVNIDKFDEITFFPVLPAMMADMVNHPHIAAQNLGAKIKLINSGGAPMPAQVIYQVRDLGILYTEGYGLSESTSLGIANPIMGLSKAGSIGIPYIDTEVRLVEFGGGREEVKPGDEGEIVMKGPTIMQAYWNDPQETQRHLKEKWFYTGDIARQDEDGYFYIVDRKKDIILTDDHRVYPREIDNVLSRHPKVREVAVVGIPDEHRGEAIKAFIVLNPGQKARDKEIIDYCKTNLALHQVPKKIEFREGLPKSAVGKILRRVLRDEEMHKKEKKI